MSYLIDTNVFSELTRPRPDSGVVDWLRTIPNEDQHLSTLTLGEMRFGAERLAPGSRSEALKIWLDTKIIAAYGDRILPVTAAVADRWARLRAGMDRTLPAIDSLIAATALHHDLRLVTRNERDFKRFPGLEVVNPWRTSEGTW